MEAPSRSVRLGSGKTIPARQRRFHRRPAVPGSRPLVCCLLLFFLPVSPTATDASSPTPPPSSPLQESGELASRVRGRGCVRRRSTSTTLSRRARARVSMADGEPSLTRWTFEDFVVHYEARFGLRREADGDDAPPPRGSDHGASRPATARANGGADLAVFEQFERMERKVEISNGAIEDGPLQKSLLPSFESAEMRNLAETLLRDIIRGSPDVKWESIKGLENAKRLLKEAVVMPIKYPKYFTGLLSPWKGILLFGPPGTGKKSFAYSNSPSDAGDSEKLVKVLFELARHHAPSTIFLDEIDAIISQRGEARSEHEASRRLKTELLIQMDGLTKTDELVFVLAATNLPWELDAAMLRRLEKRILVPLPEPDARHAMFEELLPYTPGTMEIPYDVLVEKTEGYSGSDIRLVCKEAAMQPLRRVMAVLEGRKEEVPEGELPEVGPVTTEDIELALRNTRPSAHLHAHRYEKFNQDYGSHVHG
ncbi:Katanin p60 ATPase-containing subunit A-like 2 [Zea mays]|uniref:Katanin p60 ATPase-containing subunit A-like 2 n=1 Tax=Zea mays TaxID=4577 RepID=A0A3L6DVG5_MAIZE|nr:Katanin p60 ATPase-containing subunit A-like 2 [Zea mays]